MTFRLFNFLYLKNFKILSQIHSDKTTPGLLEVKKKLKNIKTQNSVEQPKLINIWDIFCHLFIQTKKSH